MISSKEMRILEINSEALGVPTLLLMENAGSSVVEEIEKRVDLRGRSVVVFVGHGGKGGDGMVVARRCVELGANVKVIMIGENKHKDALVNLKAIMEMDFSVEVKQVKDESEIEKEDADVLIDAMLGTGLKGSIREPFRTAILKFNESRGFKVSIDLPSGYDADRGKVGEVAVNSDLVVSFHDLKAGLSGLNNVVVRKIGIPPEASIYVGPGDALLNLPRRDPRSKKGDNGKVLVIGGSHTFSGAPYFSAIASLRSGADLVYVVVPESISSIISERSPDLIVIGVKGRDFSVQNLEEIEPWIQRADAIVVGPGMGVSPETENFSIELVQRLKTTDKKVVLDADALKSCRGMELSPNFVITPHAGEFEIFSGKKPSQNFRTRISQVIDIAREHKTNILLKGFIDVISDGSRFRLNKTGNPAMTVGGTGDVLTGIIATLMARKLDPFTSAYLGAFINGLSGSLQYSKYGEHVRASDVVDGIPEVMNDPMSSFQRKVYVRMLT